MAPDGIFDTGRNLRRREFLIASAAAGLTVAGPINHAALARARKVPIASAGSFAHGVASGFPSPKAVTLWTRVSQLDRSSKVALEVATDAHFRHVVHHAQPTADKNKDFTVHARVAAGRGVPPTSRAPGA